MNNASNRLPSLQVVRPDLMDQWHSEKNADVNPSEVSAGSNRKVWWRCTIDREHEWEASISNRARGGKGCPFCAGHRTLPHKTFYFMFPKQFLEWHPSKNSHLDPKTLSPTSRERVWWKCPVDPTHEWDTLLFVRTVRGDKGCPLCTGRKASPANSLASIFPQIASEWHPSRNGDLTPEKITAKNHKKVWWQCRTCLYEWVTAVNMRTISMSKCPMCSRDAGALLSKRINIERVENADPNYEFDTDDAAVFDYRAVQLLLSSRVKITTEPRKIESALGVRTLAKTNYQPYYQRNYVWDIEKQTYFIESIIIGTEVPPLIFFENNGNSFEVIDGRQRFETLLNFQNNKLALSSNALGVRQDLSQHRFRDLSPADRDAFLDSKLRIIQFSVVDGAAISDRIQDMFKKEIFRRYNSGITPLRQIEIDRAIYITDEPSRFIGERIERNPALSEMVHRLFLRTGSPDPDSTKDFLDKALQQVRFLLVCAQMPIMATRQKETLKRFYERFSEAIDDTQQVYKEFLEYIKIVNVVAFDVAARGGTVGRFWNEAVYWAAAVLKRERKDPQSMITPVELDRLWDFYTENGEAYVPSEGQFFYTRFLARYSLMANFLERHYGVSLDGYLRRQRRSAMPPISDAPDEVVIEKSFVRLEKQDPATLNLEDLCKDIQRKRFLLRPAYQRGEVINRAKSSGIIESILLGIKLPPLYVFKRSDGVSEVVDGQQRLLSILGYTGQSFLNEDGEQVFSNKNCSSLSRLRILDELNGKCFRDLDSVYQERIWDFGLSIISIEERFNEGFSPIDLFIRLNSRPYPIKEHTFEMWNSYVDKEVIDAIKQVSDRHSKWFYITRQNERMRNEELITLLAFLFFAKFDQSTDSRRLVIDVFQRNSGINVRIKQKAAVTRMLDAATEADNVKIDLLDAIKRVDAFIRKLKTLLLTEEVDDLENHLDSQLTGLFNAKEQRYYSRKLKDFYALWFIAREVTSEIVVKRREDLRRELRDLFRSMIVGSDSSEFDVNLFLEKVASFNETFSISDRKLRVSANQRRDMIQRQGGICPLCSNKIFIHDEIDIDHIVPIALQGPDTYENMQAVHRICNRQKGITISENLNH